MTTPTIPILIFGSSGFCGRGVLKRLSSNPTFSISAHIRPSSGSLNTMQTLATEYSFDLQVAPVTEIATLIEQTQPQIICSFIGTTKRKMRALRLTYDDIDYGINHQIIEQAKHLPNPPLFVYVSSMGIEWHKWSTYLKARYKVEEELRHSHLPYVILRPGILTGPTREEARPLESVGATISDGFAQLCRSVGWNSQANKISSLNATDIGNIVSLQIATWLDQNKPLNFRTTLDVQHIQESIQSSEARMSP